MHQHSKAYEVADHGSSFATSLALRTAQACQSDSRPTACSVFIARDLSEVVVESLEGISNERQAHLRALLNDTNGLGRLDLLRLEQSRVVGLIDLVRGEVCRIDVAREAWLERSPDASERVEFDTTEEGVALNLVGAAATQTVLGVTDQANDWSACLSLS